MKLDVFETLGDGFERTFQKNGAMLAGLYLVFNLISTASTHTLYNNGLLSSLMMDTTAAQTGSWALALPLPNIVAGPALIISGIASYVLAIAAIRTLVSDETETIPKEYYSEDLLMPTLNLIAGGIAFALIIALAVAIPVAPGAAIAALGLSQIAGALLGFLGGAIGMLAAIYLLVALYFWNVFVIVEYDNFVEAFRNSWDLTEGNRLRLFILGFIVVVASGAVTGFLGIPSLLGLTVVGALLSQVGSAVTAVFTVATMAQAYNRLK